LVPEQGIEIVDGQAVASTCPAWLGMEPVAEIARCKWICLRYSASFFDEPIRPLIRFVTTNGETITLPMNGPVLGSAQWIGRVPDGTRAVAISPVRRTGPFAFRLDGLTPMRQAALVRHGLRRPDWLFWAARSRLVNSRREAWQALSFATSGTPMDAYAEWHARFARPIDLDGLDRTRIDWHAGPVFRLILRLREGDLDRLRATIRSLREQVYPHWSLCAVTDATTSSALRSAFCEQVASDTRLCDTMLDHEHSDVLVRTFDQSDFVVLIDSGDCLPDYALAVIAETVAREPNLGLIYSDEDSVTPEGKLTFPILKPDWSPNLQRHVGYLGRLLLLRSRWITRGRLPRLVAEDKTAIDELCREIPGSAIRHIRRILCRRQNSDTREEMRIRAHAIRSTDDPPQWPEVAVIIPTRDHAELLSACVAGLREKTDYPCLETVIIDNGSTAPDAVCLLSQIAAEPRTTVLRRSGPFNHSALSNDGAEVTKARIILFLNNDIAMLEPNWLKALVRWAIKPEIAAVGAKLLFPNGLIQHAGVVLGFGGTTGNIYRRLPKDHRDYLTQLKVPREVTAVTAACMAVERSKFDAVGGFDAENLPINLNDIDLCLRMIERGWTNIWTPEATLIHHQSATRGTDRDPFALDRKERDYFMQRWSDTIRDDSYFHPGLSLYSHDVALA